MLSDATSSSQSGSGSNGNEGNCHIPQISKAGYQMVYPGHSLGESYHSAEMQSADWAE